MITKPTKKILEAFIMRFWVSLGLICLMISCSETIISNTKKIFSMEKLIELNQEQITDLALSDCYGALNGEEEALQKYIYAKKLEHYAKTMQEALKEEALNERSLHNDKTLNMYGAVSSVGETGIRYDFSKNEDVKQLEDTLKSLKSMLKRSSMHDGVMTDEEGTIIPKVPVKTYSTTVLKVSF